MACKYKYKGSWYSEEDAKKLIRKDISKDEIVLELFQNYSYTVEINTAKEKEFRNKNRLRNPRFELNGSLYEAKDINEGEVDHRGFEYPSIELYYKNNKEITEEEYTKALNDRTIQENRNTSHYSNLSAPGITKGKSKYEGNPDWEYHELEISTPLITPSIKGHAQFATDNGIGWARVWYNKKTGVVEIQEVQSDLFQKGRDKEDLANNQKYEERGSASFNISGFTYSSFYAEDGRTKEFFKNHTKILKEEYQKAQEDYEESLYNTTNSKENQFLQLLNKDSNWVTFFIKSIIQDTAKQTVTEVQQEDVEAKVRELEKEGLLEIDCSGKLGFTKGGTWSIKK